VTVTPHLSGGGISVRERLEDLLLDNIQRYLAGEDLRNEIDAREVIAAAVPAGGR
jgi:phosphoglycerate dehydrogenase-like enzyme